MWGKGGKGGVEVALVRCEGNLLGDVGSEAQRVVSGSLGDIANVGDGWIHTLILPSEMSSNEKEAFERRKM